MSTRILVADTQDEVWIQVDGGGRTYALDQYPSGTSDDWTAVLCDGCEGVTCTFFTGEVTIGDGAAVLLSGRESPDAVRSVYFTPVGQ